MEASLSYRCEGVLSLQWHDVVGGTGVAVLLGTYLLLQLNRLSARSLKYSVLNAVGSGFILLSLTQAFNLSAFVIEACWLAISIIGAIITLRQKSPTVVPSTNEPQT
jgi:hypothetical protein